MVRWERRRFASSVCGVIVGDYTTSSERQCSNEEKPGQVLGGLGGPGDFLWSCGAGASFGKVGPCNC